MNTPELVALRGRLASSYVEAHRDGQDTEVHTTRLVAADSVLTAREAVHVLSRAQQAARWVEALAEHAPHRAATYAAEIERAAEAALSHAATLREQCAAVTAEGEQKR
ncbi:hypothetical protein [Streptomyces sp. NBRC 110611]|uniref:hypothetical protein n=1 Tax=Streptomyces sp. NBRC 110611 TaxID=1621259 RepID=UPI0015EE774F|nr:hypothetical protein [Streptomyces sp. NBRC 110611]